jgi:hypothetical protein
VPLVDICLLPYSRPRFAVITLSVPSQHHRRRHASRKGLIDITQSRGPQLTRIEEILIHLIPSATSTTMATSTTTTTATTTPNTTVATTAATTTTTTTTATTTSLSRAFSS